MFLELDLTLKQTSFKDGVAVKVIGQQYFDCKKGRDKHVEAKKKYQQKISVTV
jgi:hypothetical protein